MGNAIDIGAGRGRGSDPAADAPMKAADVARRLGLSVSQVYALAADGTIPAHKVGKRAWSFDRDEIEEYWRECRSRRSDADEGPISAGTGSPTKGKRPKGVPHWF